MRPLIFSFSFAKMKINEKPCNVSLLSKVIRIFLIFLFFSQKQIVDREISKRNFSGKKMSSNIYYIFWLWLMFALLMKQNNLTQLVSPLCIPRSVFFLSIKVTISLLYWIIFIILTILFMISGKPFHQIDQKQLWFWKLCSVCFIIRFQSWIESNCRLIENGASCLYFWQVDWIVWNN
jgi:hypothetical protein